jgi:hypothetical protein
MEHALQDIQPGLLHSLFGRGVARREDQRQTHEPMLVALDQGQKGSLVAVTQGL